MINKYLNYINGEFIPSSNNQTMKVINPATEEIIGEVPESTAEDARKAIDAAYAAKKEWSRLPSNERADHLRRLAAMIKENVDAIARIDTQEQGKILAVANFETDACAGFLDYAADWARKMEGEIVPSDSRGENILIYKQPRGVVAGIIPWNFSIAIIGRKVGPALIAGNTIVIKPSSNTPMNAFEFAKIVHQSGIPKGVINVISGKGSVLGRELTLNPKVNFITLTGSTESGREVARNAAENFARISLELGGKGPAIVMDDADLDLAVNGVFNSRCFANAGQICNATERVYVQENIFGKFVGKLAEAISNIKIGDPMQPDVAMGPVISGSALDNISGMVDKAVKDGAKLEKGGRRPAQFKKGFFYEPTLLTACRQDMKIMKKEIFGPVLPVMSFKTLDEAIELANDCEYGLASSVFTKNIGTAMRVVNELEFGETYVNRANMEAVQGFHAGWKKSGIGGDDGKHGLYEYLQTHVAYIQYK